MNAGSSLRPRALRRLPLYVAVGVLFGALYAGANTYFDVIERRAPLVDTWAVIHGFVDRGIPLLVGALLGVTAHYVRLRSELARAAGARVEELRARLEHVERDQAVWVVAASTLHDVRNPLHALGLLLDELAEESLTPSARHEALAKARTQMTRVKDNLASLRALAGGAMPNLGAVALDAVVDEVARDVLPIARHDGISVTVHAADVSATGDPAFVRIIVENLVANSLDVLRSRGGPGRLDIEVAERDGASVVQVHDDGPGVSSETQLFEPLSSSKARGLGLGLSIARALARAMGGDVEHRGAPGWSTTFELRLPSGVS